MPAERTTMRQVREIMRLHTAGVSTRQIGIRVGVAASTVRLTLQRVAQAGLSGGGAPEQTDVALEAALFSGSGKKIGHRRHPDPDWAAIHRELKRKHVTLTILWDEYIAHHPDGYRYDAGKVPRSKGILFPPPPRTFASQLVIGTPYLHDSQIEKLEKVFADPRIAAYLKSTDDPQVQGVLTPVSIN